MRIALFRHHAHDPLSYLISALTRGPYVHAAIYFEDTDDLYEAYWPKVRKRKFTAGEKQGVDFFRVRGLNPDGERGIRAYCEAAVAAHEPYSILGLFRFLAPARVFLGDGKEGDGKFATFCSQFDMEAVLNGAGIRLLNAPSYEVAPAQLAWSPELERAA